jgi:hypothetical protein
MTPCPACDNSVDPLRSRFVGVRDGKIVAYCSAECAAGQSRARGERAMSTGAPARVSTPPPDVPAPGGPPEGPLGRPSDSFPVIEILHEPASGVVTSARDARVDLRARHPDEAPIAALGSADPERSGAARQGTAPKPDARGSAGKADPSAAPKAQGAADAQAGRDAAEAARRTLRERTGRDSAESPEGQGAPEREAEGAARAARRDEPARDGTERVAPAADLSPRRASRWPVVLLILVLLGAGGGLLYHFFGRLSGRDAARDGRAADLPRGAPTAAVPAARAELSRPVRPSQGAAAPVVDLAAAVELARTALRRDLAATSPRVQRLAAKALARTQDPEACELLAAQIGLGSAGAPGGQAGAEADELASNDIARLDLAYALARGGDRRGAEVLARALGAPRGEARDEAAGLLARLGDRRAVPHLLDLLAVEQRRLGAAEHLARLAEPRALQVLDHVRGDPRASADDRARATVALGAAGRDAVAGALRDMLGDPHFNAFAAAALAAQGDRAARPVLERQLASPPLRVRAARALRRLDPAIDPRPLLPPLLDVVRAGRDIDRIPAAEAILLLGGPASWSAYD